ncbi:MAG TPA: protein-disulfide reductase DsbD domain-containing protein [Xanthobacteraceae bacterium]|nr:protein-disulfide reductase DsbD domain-containing protein [Xanthobacteraceae bacterium]
MSVLALTLASTLVSGGAHAADASPWQVDKRAGIRLIAGNPHADARFRAGLEIKLEPGWKTYWRYPGDSGVPPRFDFSKSENVRSVAVMWPAPHRHRDESGTTIVYTDDVIFPLRIVAQDAAKPVLLRLKLDYAICEKLCVPADGEAELVLDGGASSLDTALTAAEAQVPKPAKLGDTAPLAVRAVHREAGGAKPRILVDVAGPEPIDLFAEGPTPDWALPVPDPVGGAPAGLHRFALDVDGVPPGAKTDGATLTFTLTSSAGAIEVKAPLD